MQDEDNLYYLYKNLFLEQCWGNFKMLQEYLRANVRKTRKTIACTAIIWMELRLHLILQLKSSLNSSI